MHTHARAHTHTHTHTGRDRASARTSTGPVCTCVCVCVRVCVVTHRYVNGAADTWWQLDLGTNHQLIVTYYTLRHDSSNDFIRSWALQVRSLLSSRRQMLKHA